jgi:hypothetical protein
MVETFVALLFVGFCATLATKVSSMVSSLGRIEAELQEIKDRLPSCENDDD